VNLCHLDHEGLLGSIPGPSASPYSFGRTSKSATKPIQTGNVNATHITRVYRYRRGAIPAGGMWRSRDGIHGRHGENGIGA
jgi:hypothetical protein